MASQECSRVVGQPLTLAAIKARMNVIETHMIHEVHEHLSGATVWAQEA
jgi:hypothetical protein